jgi:hypothetical protein
VNLPYIGPIIYGSNDLTFFGSYGWLVVYPNNIEGQQARLLQSSDYGYTWNVLPMDSSLSASNIYFKSASLGYLWWDNFFYISTDSGKSWLSRSVPPSPLNGSSILEVGQPNVVIGKSNGPLSGIYVSMDTGATWNEYHWPAIPYIAVPVGPPAYIGSNTWITQNEWSTDNEQTWDTVPTTAQSVFGTMVTDTLGHGMFTGYDLANNQDDSILYFTSNFGHSWDSVKVPFGEIEEGVIIGDVWYVVPPSIDSNSELRTVLFRSMAVPSSVSQATQPPQFQILTNPATHVLELSLEEIPDEIRIVDFLGRTVAQYATQGGAFSVDVSSLPEGLYWVVTHGGARSFMHLTE